MTRDGNLFLDDNDHDNNNDRDRRRYQTRDKPAWRTLEVVVRDNVAVEVSILDLQVPRFSFRVGTAFYPQNEGDPISVGPRLTIFNARDGVELLSELEEKYTEIREKKIEELEARKRKATKRANGPVEVVVKRKQNRDSDSDE